MSRIPWSSIALYAVALIATAAAVLVAASVSS
jgi:hypothetical protein